MHRVRKSRWPRACRVRYRMDRRNASSPICLPCRGIGIGSMSSSLVTMASGTATIRTRCYSSEPSENTRNLSRDCACSSSSRAEGRHSRRVSTRVRFRQAAASLRLAFNDEQHSFCPRIRVRDFRFLRPAPLRRCIARPLGESGERSSEAPERRVLSQYGKQPMTIPRITPLGITAYGSSKNCPAGQEPGPAPMPFCRHATGVGDDIS